MRQNESIPGDQKLFIWTFSLLTDTQSDVWITNCFDDVTVRSRENQTQIFGSAEDISAVYGLITGLRDMGTTILYLEIKRETRGDATDS
jgi:hypothetical protein